jgi:DNA repair photolyase
MSTKVTEINAKSIITKSNLPDADYVINPYVGCTHACVYCYARFMRRFTGHTESWGSFIDVKINAEKIFPKNLKKYSNKSIFLSSVTDPYNPLEKEYKLTRSILKKLISIQPMLSIQTKSSLITRDIDLLKEFNNCRVGLTITSDTDETARILEPGASGIDDRLNALKNLHENNIDTYVFIGPILPFITNWKKIIDMTKKYVNVYMFENANLHGTIWKDVKNTVQNNFNNLSQEYDDFYPRRNDYWDKEEADIINYCNVNDINYKMYFDHKKIRKN